MNRGAFGVWVGITWIVTLGIAYIVGWYKGVKGVTSVAAHAAHSGLHLVMIVLIIVAIVTAIAAFKARGYLDSHHAH